MHKNKVRIQVFYVLKEAARTNEYRRLIPNVVSGLRPAMLRATSIGSTFARLTVGTREDEALLIKDDHNATRNRRDHITRRY